eukprot:Gb_38068 [translate_table: standard]
MRVAQPVWRHKKMSILFVETKLQLQGRKGTMSTVTVALQTQDNVRNISPRDVRTLCKQGRLKESVDILHVADQPLDSSTYVSLLQVCIKKKALPEGRLVHAHINARGFMADIFLQNTLVNMYAKCGSLVDTRRVFDEMPKRDVFSWTVMIAAYSRHGLAWEALALFHEMKQTDIQPNQFTYASVLPACAHLAALEQGMEMHDEIIRRGFHFDVFVGNTLIDMYAKCGSQEKARDVFDKMHQRDVVSWTALITGYVQNGQGVEAIKLFRQMRQEGVKPDLKTFASVLPACDNFAALKQGMHIHEEIMRSGFQSDVFLENSLLNMYATCGDIEMACDLFEKMHKRDMVSWNTMIAGFALNGLMDEALNLFVKTPAPDDISWNAIIGGYAQKGHLDEALKLFLKMPKPNVISWNSMIAGYTQNGQGEEALKFFRRMQLAEVKPDSKTLASVLPACANLAVLERGMEIHEEIIRSGFQSDLFVENALMYMYAKCESIKRARDVFDKMNQRDVVSWNTIIAGYAQNGQIDEACKLFEKMPEPDVVSWNAMITGYAQNGYIDEALRLFQKMPEPNIVSWNAIIAGHTKNGHGEEALKLFREMQLVGVKPDAKTFASVFSACANLAALEQGMEIHEETITSGLQFDVVVENTLVDMYSKCGSLEKARDVFDKMHQRNVVSWTAMIAGYAENGQGLEVLKLFRQMQQAGVKPDSKTFTTVLPVCANLAALEQGMEIHEEINRSGFQSDIFVANALLDMYSKCGSIEKARSLFDEMHQRNSVSWTTMIAGYAMHGYGKEALKLFEQMQHSGMNPDHVTFVCVLSACCHAGLVDEGQHHFDRMSRHYQITPTIQHYGCMVDLLGRAGRLDEAHDFINKMPIKPDASVWRCLLGACRIHNNIELGESVAERLLELDPQNAAPYVLLSNIYAAAGRWSDTENVRRMMKVRRVKKTPGCSWIEVNKQVHAFLVGDRSHPQMEDIYAKLESLSREIKAAGYMSDTRFVLNDVEEEQKEQIISHHSEKLAIAFGLINTTPGTAIRVIKNLRVCGDCHSATKFISKIAAREIVVRDASRYHHFKDGKCSCGNYW